MLRTALIKIALATIVTLALYVALISSASARSGALG